MLMAESTPLGIVNAEHIVRCVNLHDELVECNKKREDRIHELEALNKELAAALGASLETIEAFCEDVDYDLSEDDAPIAACYICSCAVLAKAKPEK
jgi:hypothetical protein